VSVGLMASGRSSPFERTAQRERSARSALRADAVPSGARPERRWMPSLRALVVALLLGAGAGSIAALWVTLDDAKGGQVDETTITASAPGKIAGIKVAQGDSVQAGQILVDFE
jgi:multidrug resistance efflux pump